MIILIYKLFIGYHWTLYEHSLTTIFFSYILDFRFQIVGLILVIFPNPLSIYVDWYFIVMIIIIIINTPVFLSWSLNFDKLFVF